MAKFFNKSFVTKTTIDCNLAILEKAVVTVGAKFFRGASRKRDSDARTNAERTPYLAATPEMRITEHSKTLILGDGTIILKLKVWPNSVLNGLRK